MIEKWNNIILAYRPFDKSKELKGFLSLLKKGLQSDISMEGCIPPSPKQKYDRKKRLSQLIDYAVKTNIGSHVFYMMPRDIKFISCDWDEDLDVLAGFIREKNIINICPKTFCYPFHIQINALVHESLHAAHAKMEEDILKKSSGEDKEPLNLYDRFCLKFLDEVSCHFCGQLAGLCFIPQNEKQVVDLRPIFCTPVYWKQYYTKMLYDLKERVDSTPCLTIKHSKRYYEIVREYFKLHPELRQPRTMRRIHKGWKIFAQSLSDDLEKSRCQKISSHSIFASFETKIPQLVDRAINIKF